MSIIDKINLEMREVQRQHSKPVKIESISLGRREMREFFELMEETSCVKINRNGVSYIMGMKIFPAQKESLIQLNKE